MWFFSTLWDIVLSYVVVWILKAAYFLLRLTLWLLGHHRRRAYFAGLLFLASQRTINWLIENKVVTRVKTIDRLCRYDDWLHPKIDRILREAKDSFETDPTRQ